MASNTIQVRLRLQLNSVLFAKTLVRKDVASSSSTSEGERTRSGEDGGNDKDDLSKAQIMTLMTTDIDRVSELSMHLFFLVGTLKVCLLILFRLDEPWI